MMDIETRTLEAKGHYNQGLSNVKNNKEPLEQKFSCGSLVHITENLPLYMEFFKSGIDATVMYTYAHAYGGDNVKDYCLDIDGYGEVSWYEEDQLTLLCENKQMSKPFYFVGKYAEVGHEEKAAGINRGRAYPVFSTYNKGDPNQKHTNAWFVCEDDAIEWARFKNTQ